MTNPGFSGPMAWASNFDTVAGPFWIPTLQANADSGEHGFNALKTLVKAEQTKVLTAASPGAAKKAGRRVTLRPDWDGGVRVAAMSHVLRAKFALPNMEQKLLGTGSQILVETNYWHDQFWGDCYCAKHASVPGKNMLGELLMAIRAQKRGL